jgi:hypothetical protein
MSDYTKTTNFTAKDALLSGNPNKIIKGVDFDTEFDAIATAVASKADSTALGTMAGENVPTGIVKGDGTNVSAAVAGTDYLPATSGSDIQKADGAGGLTAASAGTDYQAPLVAGTDYQTPLVAETDYVSPDGLQKATAFTLTSVSGTDTITATGPSPFSALANGQEFSFFAAGANTGAVTLNISSVGATSVTKSGGTALAAGDIPAAGAFVKVKYDSANTRFEIMGGAGGGGGGGGASADGCIWENAQTISTNYTMTTNYNGHSVGPIQISSGITVTIPSGSRWVVA